MPTTLYVYRARLVRVIDGDTVVLCVSLGFGVAKLDADNHFRVLGVACPEVRGAEREAGLAAKAYVVDWFTPTVMAVGEWPLIIQTERLKGSEVRTFERWVAAIWRLSDGHSLADDLITSGHGVLS